MNKTKTDSTAEYDLYIQTSITNPIQYYHPRQFSAVEAMYLSDIFDFIGVRYKFVEVI